MSTEGGTVLTVASIPDLRFQTGLHIAVASPEQTLSSAWTDTLPRLSMAALSALLALDLPSPWWVGFQ